ncbi:attractin-like protein 1 [Exaiptasia diaphana]|uniref:Attractin n=1 Tax=Exaiptasia diaphana TaxID=2652724 RepID=A0A913Y073_EXADI|nr:attractin-like protein 1 [Exaiptasia diaphana]KXJ23470.1 Attractin-like protein 1 [Exaiptasia diaphana]
MTMSYISFILTLSLVVNTVVLIHGGFYKVSECDSPDCPACEPGYWGQNCKFCRLRLTSDKGIITDGDKNYEQSSKCTWLIETSRSNSSIELVFDQFATECAWDHLYVYAGNSIHAPLLGTLSGLLRDTNIKAVAKDPIRHLTIKSNQAFLYFFSDANYILTGFNIKYRVKSDCSIKCNNHGQCGDQGNCICDEGWAGSSCNISTCPVSCVSGTCDTVTRQCQGCNSGYTGPSCNVTLGQGFWAHIPANNQENIIGRASHGAGLIDEWLWVYGGYSLNTAPFDDLIRYHLPSNAWEVVEPLSVPVPSRRYGHSLIVYNGSLIIYGGTINGKVINQLWSFDTISRQWTLLLPDRGSDDPIAVSGHTATLVDNKMFVIFGYGPQEGYTQKVQEFDLVSRQWKFHSVNALIVLATFGHSSSYDPTTGRIYVFGGYRKITKQEISNELSFYLPSQNKWGVLLSSGYRRFLHSSVMMGDMLIVFGGNAHNDTANKSEKKAKCFTIDTFMYNTRCNVWSKISTEPLTSLNGRYGHTAVQANGTMYIFGGFQGTMLNDMLTYTPGDCSAYTNKTSCFQASSSYGCARDVKKDSCIGPLDIPSHNPATIERVNCPASSNRCSTFDNCDRCLTSVFNCKWCRNVCKESSNHCDDKLVVSDLKKCPTIPPGSCSISGCASHTQCSNYSSCEGCVGNKDCIWCESQKQCVGLHAYILSFPYGQCHEWTKDKCTDVRCEDRMTCNDCHTLPGCGWCDDGSGTGLGKCTGGGDDGPFIPASNSSVITSDKCLPKDGKKRWFFIECPVCQCNGHSTCDEYDKCIACKDNTNGSHCQTCAKGYHGNPKNGGKCETCQCNEHGNVCNSESGVCDCQTKGVTGANCELCDDRKYYYGNSTNGGFCYYNLTSGYMFTFNVTGYTGVSFFNIPKRDDRNVQFSVKVIGDGAMMNMTYKYKSGPELALFNEKYLGNGVKYENSFKHDDFSFATSDRLTFFVYVYNVNGNCMIEISFSQISPFKLLQFFLTFFGCFFSILVVTFIAWKIRIRYNLHVMRRQRIVEMHKMAKRPSSTLKLSFEKHNDTYITKSFCNHVTIQPFAGSNAAVGTFVLRLPSLPNGFTPIGQSGMCFGSVLIDHRNHSSNAAHRCYTFQKPSDKRSRRTTQCI